MKVPLVLLLLQLTATWSTLIMRIRSVSKEAPRIEIVPAATPSATFKMMKMVMNTASTIRGMTWRRAAARGSGNERGEHVGDNFVVRVRQYYGTGATDKVLKSDRNKECAGRAGTDVPCEDEAELQARNLKFKGLVTSPFRLLPSSRFWLRPPDRLTAGNAVEMFVIFRKTI